MALLASVAPLEPLLARITREYAARDALRQARSHLSDALVCVGD